MKAYDSTGLNVDNSYTGSVTLTPISGSGYVSDTYSVSADAGVATFSSCNLLGKGDYWLEASASGLTSATSGMFVVADTSATGATGSIVFQETTLTATVGRAFTIVVEAKDAGGYTDTTFPGTVTLAATGLTGTLSSTFTNGLATFNDLEFAAAGSETVTMTCDSNCSSFTVGGSATVTVTKTGALEIKSTNGLTDSQLPQTYSIRLNSAPTSSVTVSFTGESGITFYTSSLTFTTANYNTWQDIEFSATFTESSGTSLTKTITHTLTTTDPNFNGVAEYECCWPDDDAGAVSVTIYDVGVYAIRIDSEIIISEGETKSINFSISQAPSSDVTITASTTSSYFTLATTSVTFTSSNYSTKTISVTAATNVVTESTASYSDEISYTITTSDPKFTSSSAQLLPSNLKTVVSVVNDDYSRIVISGSYLSLMSAETATYTVKLSIQPTALVRVQIAVSDTSILSLSSSTLSFTTANYDTPQSVTVTFTLGSTSNPTYIDASITHTIGGSSDTTDAAYQNTSATLPVVLINACTPGIYSWPGGSSCTYSSTKYATDAANEVPYSCGAGQYKSSSTGGCVDCPAGKYCRPHELEANIQTCSDGYTNSATKKTECTICAGGTKCTSNSSTSCNTGEYSFPGSSTCSSCPAGSFCASTTVPFSTPCKFGTISSAASTTCTNCSAGKSCVGNTAETSCATGTYSPAGTGVCFTCPSNTICISNSGSESFCDVNKKPNAAQTSCTACTSSEVCSPVSGSTSGACGFGYYLDTTGSSGSCKICAKDKSCTLPSTTAACSDSYSPGGWYNCISCPFEGYIASSICSLCDDGKESCNGSACAAGFYKFKGVNSCSGCAPGSKCDTNKSKIQDDLCPTGSYCNYFYGASAATLTATTCAVGTKARNTAAAPVTSSVTACDVCDNSKTCDGTTESNCTKGKFCPYGAGSGISCPQGFYSIETTQAGTQFECIECSAGNACNVDTDSDTKNPCTSGAYCPFGTTSPALFYCPWGKLNASTSQDSISDCTACGVGTECPFGTSVNNICMPGYYNTNPLGFCYASSASVHSPTGKLSDFSSFTCKAGYYCPLGTTSPNYYICPSGNYGTATDLAGVGECTTCESTYYCTGGNSSNKLTCSAGHICPDGTEYGAQFKCWSGRYNTLTGQTACTDCPAGSSCVVGSDSTQTCAAGYYCPLKSIRAERYPCPAGTFSSDTDLTDSSECSECTAGHYCPKGYDEEIPCPDGTYAENPGQTECDPCPDGKECYDSASTSTPKARTGADTAAACPKGQYSPEGESTCIDCEDGYYCDQDSGTTVSQMYSQICDAGLLCTAAPSNDVSCCAGNTCTHDDCCPAGYYCLAGATSKIACPYGKYRDVPGGTSLSDCSDVPAGYYGPVMALTDSDQYECPKGYYCPAGTIDPTPCPVGTYGDATGYTSGADCVPCDAGSYCPFPGMTDTTLITCTQGYYCVEGTISPIPCPKGTYGGSTGLTASSGCTACTGGKYCDEEGMTAPKGDCKAGFYCTGGAISSMPTDGTTGNICSVGGYCPEGSSAAVACADGKYNKKKGSKTQDDCIDCPPGRYCSGTALSDPTGLCTAGYYCTGGASTATQHSATAGYYSLEGYEAMIPCPAGTWAEADNADSCDDCPAGKYCPNTGTGATGNLPISCPTGHYCLATSIAPIPCPLGTYNSAVEADGLDDCIACDAGKYCAEPGLSAVSGDCTAGFKCISGSIYREPVDITDPLNEDYGPCDPGYYCDDPSSPTACPAGTYNPFYGAASLAECMKCPAGKYCEGTANIEPDGDCSDGFICEEGSTAQDTVPCTVGHYCLAGNPANPIACEPGTYTDQTGQSECVECPEGKFCPLATGDLSTQDCPDGFLCPAGTSAQYSNPCPIGQYKPTSASYVSTCTDCVAGEACQTPGSAATSGNCDAGYYCNEGSRYLRPFDGSTDGGICRQGNYCPAGSSGMVECDQGKYCDEDMMSAVKGNCFAGFYCLAGSKVPGPTNESTMKGDICPAGSYCAAGAQPVECAIGKYLPYTGASSESECLQCPAGYYCDEAGLANPKICPAGYYCPNNTSDYSTNPCTIGHKCPEGSYTEIECPPGFYQDETQQSTCKSCTAGNYCEKGATALTPCPAGYYCLSETPYRYQYPCPPGTYNSNTGGTALASCLTCPAGKYCERPGVSDLSSRSCSVGWYCLAGAVTPKPIIPSQGGICDKGYYCPDGEQKLECDPGKYCPQKGLSEPAGDCLDGFYCISKSIYWAPTDGVMGNICGAGKYCPAGAFEETDCPAGTFSAGKGLAAANECTPCLPGYYCPNTGMTAATTKCPAGYYCPSGSSSGTANTCTTGHYCPLGASYAIECPAGTYTDTTGNSECLACPAGKYCVRGTVTPVDCIAGHYCPQGTRFSDEFPCPAGSYSDTTGKAACDPCPAGNECPPGSSTSGTPCPIYKYCPQGTGYGLICPAGSYNTANTGLTSSSACTACPAGKYCVDGRITGDCEAGYMCVGSSPTPTPVVVNVYGYPCPMGNYCPAGTQAPIACPTGKFRTLPGGRQESDCTDCPPGYYCVAGNSEPIKCPSGAYCPAGISEPIKCPKRTYYSGTGAQDKNSCTVCPGGYLCTDEGISDYTLYPCRVGYYCVLGATFAVACPPGTYGTSDTADSIKDCELCRPGHYCRGGSDILNECEAGTYCPEGTSIPIPCPVGYYCKVRAASPEICPIGYYCPKYDFSDLSPYQSLTTQYIACDSNKYCPIGSYEEQNCEEGYQLYTRCQICEDCPKSENCAKGYKFIVRHEICEKCAEGYYSNESTNYKCEECSAGYICTGGAIRPNPIDEALHGGYPCPAGYYCPQGSLVPLPCPAGTYNTNLAMASATDCMLCPKNTYNPYEGQVACLPCGSYAYSNTGSVTCECNAKNRAYMKSDGTCRCIPTYQFISENSAYTEESSDVDCIPQVFDFCPEGTVRKPDGGCAEQNDCSDECFGGSGSRALGNGLCICDEIQSIDNVCNKACRESSFETVFKGDGIYVIDPVTQEELEIDISDDSGYLNFVECMEDSCKAYCINMQDDGPEASYDLCSSLQNHYEKAISSKLGSDAASSRLRRLQNSAGIKNPVACIHINEIFIFSVQPDHYPVYSKDSLLNNNDDFDFGPFKELERMMNNNPESVTTFATSFTQQGVYDFVDSSDSDLHMIISVIGEGEQCLDKDIPMRPRTEGALLTVGAQARDDIIYDPNWTMIILVMVWTVFIISAMLAGFYFFHIKAWMLKQKSNKDYRLGQMLADLEVLTKPPEVEEENSQSVSEEDEKSDKAEEEEKVKDQLMQDTDDFDPALFQAIYDKLLEENRIAQIGFEETAGKSEESLDKILTKIRKIKDFLIHTLEALEAKHDEVSSDDEQDISQDTDNIGGLINKYLEGTDETNIHSRDAMYQEILANKDLDEADIQDLVDDFNANLQRLQDAIGQDKDKAQSNLNKRLLERQARRKKTQAHSAAKQSYNSLPLALIEERAQSEDIDFSDIEKALSVMSEDDRQEYEKGASEIEKQIQEDLEQRVSELKNNLSKKLEVAKDRHDSEEIMRQFENEADELEQQARAEREKQEMELLRRLAARKMRKQRGSELSKAASVTPDLIKAIEEDATLKQLEAKQGFEKQYLTERQKNEILAELEPDKQEEAQIVEQLKEAEDNEEVNKKLLEEKARLEAALSSSSSESQRNSILESLRNIEQQIQDNTTGQREKLNQRLYERRKQRALKEAEIKKRQAEERAQLQEKHALEEEKMKDDLAIEKVENLLDADMDPEILLDTVSRLMDQKHENEIAGLIARKHAIVTDKQTQALQEALAQKSNELTDTRKRFKVRRDELERRKLSEEEKKAELERINKREADALNIIDYNFINGINREQDKIWRDAEESFREKFMALTEKHMKEIGDILKLVRQKNPKLAEIQLVEANKQAQALRDQVELEYREKVQELDKRQAEIQEIEAQRETEINSLMREIEEAERKRRELDELAQKRKEVEERQKAMREEMQRRGISPAQMEEMIKKHQLEMGVWESAMDKERNRQRQRLQEKLEKRMEKAQEKIIGRIQAYKQQNLQIMNKQEELGIRLSLERPPILHEVIRDIDTNLRTRPLPQVIRGEIQVTTDEGSILEALLRRVRRVEKIVENVDAVQFENLVQSIQNAESKLRSITRR